MASCSSVSACQRWTYEYDPLGRRIRKTGPAGTTEFIWDGPTLAEVLAPEGQKTAWFYQPGTFRPIAKLDQDGAYACVTDQIGTPKELVSREGKIAWSSQLTAFGELEKAMPEATTRCNLRFQGQYRDEETGLHYNFHRYYEPQTGRYLSPDPIGLEGGTRSYGYVHNPTMWVDPFGLAGDPATSTHITYVGVDQATGKPYVGYASMPGQQSGQDVLNYRYGNDFSRFSSRPDVVYEGYGADAKMTARGLEQRTFEDFRGLDGTANKQNPVGEQNPNRDAYLKAADRQRASSSQQSDTELSCKG